MDTPANTSATLRRRDTGSKSLHYLTSRFHDMVNGRIYESKETSVNVRESDEQARHRVSGATGDTEPTGDSADLSTSLIQDHTIWTGLLKVAAEATQAAAKEAPTWSETLSAEPSEQRAFAHRLKREIMQANYVHAVAENVFTTLKEDLKTSESEDVQHIITEQVREYCARVLQSLEREDIVEEASADLLSESQRSFLPMPSVRI
jgi:signal recognition particle GTPase